MFPFFLLVFPREVGLDNLFSRQETVWTWWRMLTTVSAEECQALYSCFLSSARKNYSHSFYSHSLLFFGGGNHDSKLWKPFPLVACSLEELPLKPVYVEQAGHWLSWWPVAMPALPPPGLGVVPFTQQCFPPVSKREQKYSNNKDILTW